MIGAGWVYVFLATLSTIVLPIPEEATLLGAGYAARLGHAPLAACVAAGWLGIMIGDTIGYWVGRALLARILRTELGKRLLPERWRAWAEGAVHGNGARAVVLARFFVGLRGFLYFAIGASRYSFARFLAANALAAVAEVGILEGLGFEFAELHLAPELGQRMAVAVDLLGAAGLLAAFAGPSLVRARVKRRA